jgi:hypothetical protein
VAPDGQRARTTPASRVGNIRRIGECTSVATHDTFAPRVRASDPAVRRANAEHQLRGNRRATWLARAPALPQASLPAL